MTVQNYISKLKRGLAMFLVVLSLVGMIPFDAIDLTMTAEAIGDADRGSSVRAMGGPVGTYPGNWQADVTSTPFVRYTLVEFPNEADEPDNYKVLGMLNICDDKWKSTLTKDSVTKWLGVAPALLGDGSTRGRPLCAVDYRKYASDDCDLLIYNAPRGTANFMTRSNFDAIASAVLPALASKYGIDPSSEDYKEHYEWKSDKKLICDFNTQGGNTDGHISQFGVVDSEAGASGDSDRVKVYKTGDLFNAVVAMCSVGFIAAGNHDGWVDAVKERGMNYAEFSQEKGPSSDGHSTNCSYRILVEPGCSIINKNTKEIYLGTARDHAMLAHIIDGPGMTESKSKIAWNQKNMREHLLYLTNQSVDEFTVYDPSVLRTELAKPGTTQAAAVKAAIAARSQNEVFKAISPSAATSAKNVGGLKWFIGNVFPNLSGYTSSGIKNGSYALSIISPTEIVPGSTDFRIRKTSNIVEDRTWQFTVELTDSSGAPVSDTFGDYTFTDGKCTVELKADELAIFNGIPEGCKATVTEIIDPADSDITVTVNGQPGPTWTGEANMEVVFDNSTSKPQDFTIQKEVTGDGDKDREWTFNVEFDKSVSGASYSIDGGSETPFSGTSCTVKLKHGQRCTFKNVPDNINYKVTEVEANQDGYTTSPGATIEGLIMDKPLAKFTNKPGTPPPPPGEPDPGTPILQKKDAFDGKNIGPATYLFTGIDTQWKSRYTTDANGSLTLQWSNPGGDNYIKPGSYSVREVIAPVGYDLTEEVQEIQFLPDGKTHTGPLVFKNNRLKTITLLKKDPTGKDLDGAIFEVYKDGKYEGTVITQGGKAEYAGKNSQGLTDGYYEFVEIQAPGGYIIPKNNRVGVHVDSSMINGRDPIEVSMVNWETPIIIPIKMKAGTTEGLAGAFFEVMVDGTIVGEFGPTDNDGRVEISIERVGEILGQNRDDWTLQVREIVAPEGYFIDDENWKTVEIKGGRTEVEVPFYNTPYPEIKIYKRDTNTRELLPGATFDVQIDGSSIGDKTTGPDGTITITWEEYGKFLRESDTDEELFSVTVTEKTAPEGYTIDMPNTQTKPLKRGDKLLEFEFNDTKYPEIWVRKIDHETGEPLAGMTFEVEIDGKKLNAQWTTTEEDVVEREGWHKITFEEYKEFLDTQGGWFTDERGYTVKVTETSAPQFYNKDRQLGSESGADYTIVRQLNSNSSRVEFTFEDTHYRSLKVRKIDSETQWPLLGAEFTLKLIRLENQDLNASKPNGWGDGVSKVGKTNDQGEYVFENLPNGEYLLTETHAPQGYHGIDDTDTTKRGYWTDTRLPGSRTIVITSSSGSDGIGGNPDAANRVIEYTYANEPKSGIKIFKKDGVTGHSIEGARFRITPLSPLEEASWEEVTDSNGLIVIENDLKYGTYMIEELEVPAPYHVDHTPQYIELNDQHDAYSVTFNNYADGMVYIRKLDSKTGLPVAGARFEIRKADGTLLDDTLITGVDGYIDYGPLVPGESYVVTEIEAPPGYTISNPSVQPFTVPENASGWVKSLIFKDDPLCNLWLRKIDAETGLGLQGAVFEIRTGEGTIIRQNEVTDQQGYVKVDGLIEGSYIVRETKAPNGYMLDDSDHHVVLRSGQTEVVLIENTKPGGLVIYKIDAATKQPLEDAVFQLYDINDTPIGAPVKTGKDGYARWADLTPGQYQVEEITAPDGYQRTTGRRKFEVKEFNSITYEWPNAEEATITIYKRDGETLLPLGGAEFEIRKTK